MVKAEKDKDIERLYKTIAALIGRMDLLEARIYFLEERAGSGYSER